MVEVSSQRSDVSGGGRWKWWAARASLTSDRRLPACAARRRPTSGFTIVELLVVIAIIALLAALLFPALGRARESGKRAVCMSNLRQWGLVAHGFADDNEGRFPQPYRMKYVYYNQTGPGLVADWNSNPWYYGTFYSDLKKYGLTDGISLCPSGGPRAVTNWGDSTWWGFAKRIGYQYIGGAYNGLYNWAYHNNGPRHGWNNDATRPVAARGADSKPEGRFMAADLVILGTSSWAGWGFQANHQKFSPHPLKLAYQNVLFADGHVEGKGPNYYPEPVSYSPANYSKGSDNGLALFW